MDEIEQLSRSVQHTAPHQLFHRGHRGEAFALVTEAVQTAQYQPTDALGHRESTGSERRLPFPDLPQRLYNHERMPLARCPDLVTQGGRKGRSARRHCERSDQLERLRLIKRREYEADQPVVSVEIVKYPPKQGSAFELVVARGPNDQDWCTLAPPD